MKNLGTTILCLVCGLVGFGASHIFGSSTLSDSSSNAPSLESFAAAMDDTNLLTRSHGYSEFLLTLSPENLDEALVIFTAREQGLAEHDLRMFMLAWSRFDAPGAFEWARAHEASENPALSGAAMFAWGYHDPRAALEKLEEIGEYNDGSSSLAGLVVNAWSQNGDVEGLSEFIITMPKTHDRLFAAAALTTQIMRDGVEELIEWAESVPADAPEGFKRVAFHESISTIARRDPERAVEWFKEHQGQEYAGGSLDLVARRWVDFHDAADLMARLTVLPEDEDRKKAIGIGMRWWLRRTPEEAIAWIEGLETLPADLDPAIAAVARYHSKKSARLATIWAARLNDDELRLQSLRRYGRQWRARQPEQVEAWLESSALRAHEKAAILAGPSSIPEARKPRNQRGQRAQRRPR